MSIPELENLSEDQIAKMKLDFAEALLRQPDNSHNAAMKATGGDWQLSLAISYDWRFDPEVEECKKLLLEQHGAEHFLPTKEELLYEIYQRGRQSDDDDSFVKCMRLAADMRGQIEKPGVTVNNNITNTTNKVMAIPMMVNPSGDRLDVDEWEQGLIDQQERLISQ